MSDPYCDQEDRERRARRTKTIQIDRLTTERCELEAEIERLRAEVEAARTTLEGQIHITDILESDLRSARERIAELEEALHTIRDGASNDDNTCNPRYGFFYRCADESLKKAGGGDE